MVGKGVGGKRHCASHCGSSVHFLLHGGLVAKCRNCDSLVIETSSSTPTIFSAFQPNSIPPRFGALSTATLHVATSSSTPFAVVGRSWSRPFCRVGTQSVWTWIPSLRSFLG